MEELHNSLAYCWDTSLQVFTILRPSMVLKFLWEFESNLHCVYCVGYITTKSGGLPSGLAECTHTCNWVRVCIMRHLYRKPLQWKMCNVCQQCTRWCNMTSIYNKSFSWVEIFTSHCMCIICQHINTHSWRYIWYQRQQRINDRLPKVVFQYRLPWHYSYSLIIDSIYRIYYLWLNPALPFEYDTNCTVSSTVRVQ